MLVKYAMETDIVRVAAGDGVRKIVEALVARGHDAALVVDDHGSLLGVVDVQAILNHMLPTYVEYGASLAEVIHDGYFEEVFTRLAQVSAADVMEPLAKTDAVAPDDGVMKAAALFVEHHRILLPVLEEGRPVGVISCRGLLDRAVKRSV